MSISHAAQTSLWQITSERRALLEEIEVAGGELTPDLEARWKELDKSVASNVDEIGRQISVLESEAEMFEARYKTHAARAITRRKMVDRLRTALGDAMQTAGQKSLKGEEFSASLRQSAGSVVIEDETKFVKDYCYTALVTVRPGVPNKEEIAKHLKAGKEVPGASLVKSTYVVVK